MYWQHSFMREFPYCGEYQTSSPLKQPDTTIGALGQNFVDTTMSECISMLVCISLSRWGTSSVGRAYGNS